LGTFLFIILVVMVLAALLGAGGYSVRRYWSPAGTEVVETSDSSGAGAGIAAALIALLVLILLFFGFTRWNWFGNEAPSGGQSNTPVVTSPAASPSSGSGGSSPSSSPAASPS
jgi:hypothetical protein